MYKDLMRKVKPGFLLMGLMFYGQVYAAKGTITWLDTELPPQHHINEGSLKDQGIADNIYGLIKQNMTQYDHTLTILPLKRLFLTMEEYGAQDKVACSISLKYSAERARIGDFSIPALFIPGHGITYRKDDKNKFKDVNFRDLIKNKNLHLGVNNARVYGEPMDSLIKENLGGGQIEVASAGNSFSNQVQMLLNHRLDYVLGYAMEYGYTGRTLDTMDKISFSPIAEAEQYSFTYIMCSKTKNTAEVLKEINQFLVKYRPSTDFRKYHEMWLDKDFISQYRTDYEAKFITNTVTPPGK